ncbi:electron transfer flavoprotein subunit alpha/FixB family protein, partial [Burkholderia sp. Bp9031]
MTILVIAECDAPKEAPLGGNASIKAATLNTVAAAAKIGGDIHVLV